MDMDAKLKNVLRTTTVDRAVADAQLRILEGIITDFFRLTIIPSNFEELRDGVGQLSRKLLNMQETALNNKETATQILADIQRVMIEQQSIKDEHDDSFDTMVIEPCEE